MPIESLVSMQSSALAAEVMAAAVKAMQASTAGIIALLEASGAAPGGPTLDYTRALDVRV